MQFHRVKLPNRFIPINLGEAKYRTPVEEVPKPLIAAETLVNEGEKEPMESTANAEETVETKEEIKGEHISEI